MSRGMTGTVTRRRPRPRRRRSRHPGRPGSPWVPVVGTPIGNLGDLSPRAVAALAAADVVYCEDTRHSRKLLTHAGITGASLRSLHEHNEDDRIDEVLGRRGRAAAPWPWSPTPACPASRTRARGWSRRWPPPGLTVTVVPGPSAVLAALVGSGLATDRFCFEGFLPRSGRDAPDRPGRRGRRAPHHGAVRGPRPGGRHPGRPGRGLRWPDRRVAVARELTKLHEEFWRGTLADAAAWAAGHGAAARSCWSLAGAPEAPGTGGGRRADGRAGRAVRAPGSGPAARSTRWRRRSACPAGGSTTWPWRLTAGGPVSAGARHGPMGVPGPGEADRETGGMTPAGRCRVAAHRAERPTGPAPC